MPQKSTESIELGLAVLSVINTEGYAFTETELSDVLGCARMTLRHIEKRALRKLKAQLAIMDAREHTACRTL